MLIDTHCHLDFPEFNQDRDEVIRRARENGIAYIINIGSSLQGSERSLELARKYNFIYASVGIHPHEADTVRKDTLLKIEELARQDKVVAIGETGLDYFKNYSQAGNQQGLFISLVNLANKLKKPLVIHNRQAENDTLKVLKEARPRKVVVHCFSGDEYFLSACLDLDFYISFTCNVTYKKGGNLRNLLKRTPLDKLLLETDAPFLPPQLFRGKRNEPLYVRYLAEEVARIKQIEPEEVARITTDNAKLFFGIY